MALPQTNPEIVTPIGERKIILRSYPTARMQQSQSAIFLRYSKVDLTEAQNQSAKGKDADNSKVVNIGDLPGSALQEINQLTVKNYVISIDGNDFGGDKDAILEECLDMHAKDYEAILNRCNEINKESEINDSKKAS